MLATANGRIKNGPSQTRAIVWVAFLFKKYVEFLFYLFILKSNHMSLVSALQQTTLGACPPSLPPCPEDSQILQGPAFFSYPILLCNPQRHGLPGKLLAGWPRNETSVCCKFCRLILSPVAGHLEGPVLLWASTLWGHCQSFWHTQFSPSLWAFSA